MKRNIAYAWAKYLENPRRKQAVGVLDAGEGKRCCLGHLCYMLKIERMQYGDRYCYDRSTQVLPKSAMIKAGMKSCTGDIGGPDSSLAGLNDDGRPLPEIAKVIRENWRDL